MTASGDGPERGASPRPSRTVRGKRDRTAGAPSGSLAAQAPPGRTLRRGRPPPSRQVNFKLPQHRQERKRPVSRAGRQTPSAALRQGGGSPSTRGSAPCRPPGRTGLVRGYKTGPPGAPRKEACAPLRGLRRSGSLGKARKRRLRRVEPIPPPRHRARAAGPGGGPLSPDGRPGRSPVGPAPCPRWTAGPGPGGARGGLRRPSVPRDADPRPDRRNSHDVRSNPRRTARLPAGPGGRGTRRYPDTAGQRPGR